MNLILRLKNWQLFLISILIPFTLAFGLTAFLQSNYDNESFIIGLASMLYYAVFILWNYKVIKTLNKQVLILKTQHIKRLDWLLIILPIYSVYLLFPDEMFFKEDILLNILSPIYMLLMIYAYLFMVFCTAKTLKGFELKEQLRNADIIVEMFAILYFPIGIWWLQKRVNKYYGEIQKEDNNLNN